MATTAAKAARRKKFEIVFSKIRDELIEHFAGEGMPQEAVEWYRNVRACQLVHYTPFPDPLFFSLIEPRVQCPWR